MTGRLKRFAARGPFRAFWIARAVAFVSAIRALPARWRLSLSTYVDPTVKVTGWSHVLCGRNSVIGAGTWLNVNDRGARAPSLIIGDNCFIGRNNFVTVGRRVVIGDYCLTATGCAFIGSSHNIDDPFRAYISSGVQSEAEILVGPNCFFGFGSAVLGNVSVGFGSVIGAGAFVFGDVPPFSVVVGNPGRIIKRYSISRRAWVSSEAYVPEPLPTQEEYLEVLRSTVGYYPLPLSAATSALGDV